jgi:hypothetical protein
MFTSGKGLEEAFLARAEVLEDVFRRAVDRPRLRRPQDAAAVVHWPVDGTAWVGRRRRRAPSGITGSMGRRSGLEIWKR